MGCCGLDLPQLASQSWDVFQSLMFLFKPQKGFLQVACAVTHVPELSGAEANI